MSATAKTIHRVDMPQRPDLLLARIFARTKRYGDCIFWQGATRNGYGAIKFNKKVHAVHRIVYWLTHGEIPANAIIMHSCDHKLCININHLDAGDWSRNALDAFVRGLSTPVRGENHGNASLTAGNVQEILAFRKKTGWGWRRISRHLNFPGGAVSHVLNGDTWMHRISLDGKSCQSKSLEYSTSGRNTTREGL